MNWVALTLYSFLSCRSEVNSLNFLSEAAVQNLHPTDKKKKKKALRSINSPIVDFEQAKVSLQFKPVKQHAKGNSESFNWNLPVKKTAYQVQKIFSYRKEMQNIYKSKSESTVNYLKSLL